MTTTKNCVLRPLVILLLLVAIVLSSSFSSDFRADGGVVIELNESNFDAAISSLDYVLVDFYAPWCGHCKKLSPQLDVAAPALAGLDRPIVIAKVNADKYTRLASKYEIGYYPTLKLFIHGFPVDYSGPHTPDLLVRYLKKFVAPNVSLLESDNAVNGFVESAGIHFPIFIGFGLNESLLAGVSAKYKKKAWFSVAKDFSEDVMMAYDFDKVPALVSLHPSYKEQGVFYGPFEDDFLEDYVKQNLLPPCLPINYDTLKLLKDDDRKIVLTVMDDELEDKSQELIKLLKAAASANRDLIFGYVGAKQWGDFVETFEVNKRTKLPKMLVWDGNEEYFSVVGSEWLHDEENQGSQITQFLQGYREGRSVRKSLSGPSFIGYINSLVSIRTVYLIVFVVAVVMLIRSISGNESDDIQETREGIRDTISSGSERHHEEAYNPRDKED